MKTDLCEGHKPTHLKYRITCAEYGQLLARFGGSCDRCGQEVRKPVIDHDHSLGDHAVRGMICHRCNIILGTIEQGGRPDDDLTRAYLVAPFHLGLTPVLPGYRFASDPEIPALVCEEGAANILRMPRRKVRRFLAEHDVPGVQVDGMWVFRRTVVEAARATPDPE